MNVEDVFHPYLVKSAAKRVTDTDKAKRAYVLTAAQFEVLRAAGMEPDKNQRGRTIRSVWTYETDFTSLSASFYLSQRSEEANRSPEPRMGLEIIGDWINVGDELFLGTDGKVVFAVRNPRRSVYPEDKRTLEERLCRLVSLDRLELACPPNNPARRQKSVREEFVRSPVVVELVKRRANGACEFPGCRQVLFEGEDGWPFLEVHHIEWLRNGGADRPENAAGLCPMCHRAQHHARDRERLTTELAKAIRRKLMRSTTRPRHR